MCLVVLGILSQVILKTQSDRTESWGLWLTEKEEEKEKQQEWKEEETSVWPDHNVTEVIPGEHSPFGSANYYLNKNILISFLWKYQR